MNCFRVAIWRHFEFLCTSEIWIFPFYHSLFSCMIDSKHWDCLPLVTLLNYSCFKLGFWEEYLWPRLGPSYFIASTSVVRILDSTTWISVQRTLEMASLAGTPAQSPFGAFSPWTNSKHKNCFTDQFRPIRMMISVKNLLQCAPLLHTFTTVL